MLESNAAEHGARTVDSFDCPESSTILRADYDYHERYMRIWFNRASLPTPYGYRDIPPDIWETFKAADSKGRYFGVWIRSQFEAERLDTPDATPPSTQE